MTYTRNRNQRERAPETFTINGEEFPLQEKVVKISRVAKVIKGGRHLSFSAVVVVGDGNGHVGIGLGKADAVPDAVRKGAYDAKKNIITVHLKDRTIPHEVTAHAGASEVRLLGRPDASSFKAWVLPKP